MIKLACAEFTSLLFQTLLLSSPQNISTRIPPGAGTSPSVHSTATRASGATAESRISARKPCRINSAEFSDSTTERSAAI